MKTRIVLTAALAGLAFAPSFAATPVADAGPWAKVPALPTACYVEQDGFRDRNNAALEAVQQDHYAQNDVNGAIEQQFRKVQEENPMALAQAMQQAMMNDPQNAQKYMEQMMNQGQQSTQDVTDQGQKEMQFDAEAKALVKQYQAALAQAYGPAEARWQALKKKRGYGPEVNMPGESGEPDWVWTEYTVVLRERDAGYVANCAKWWGAGKPIHAYLKRYKDYLVQERIPSRKKMIDDVRLDQYKTVDIPTAGYRTVQDYEAAELYIKRAGELFDERAEKPRCPTADRCEAMY